MTALGRARLRRQDSRGRRRRQVGLAVGGAVLSVEAITLTRLGYPPAGNVVVRCRDGHLFTTIWVPGVSLKSLRLGPWRLQRCPVGRHWSLVTPVRRIDLTPEEQNAADAQRDIRLP